MRSMQGRSRRNTINRDRRREHEVREKERSEGKGGVSEGGHFHVGGTANEKLKEAREASTRARAEEEQPEARGAIKRGKHEDDLKGAKGKQEWEAEIGLKVGGIKICKDQERKHTQENEAEKKAGVESVTNMEGAKEKEENECAYTNKVYKEKLGLHSPLLELKDKGIIPSLLHAHGPSVPKLNINSKSKHKLNEDPKAKSKAKPKWKPNPKQKSQAKPKTKSKSKSQAKPKPKLSSKAKTKDGKAKGYLKERESGMDKDEANRVLLADRHTKIDINVHVNVNANAESDLEVNQEETSTGPRTFTFRLAPKKRFGPCDLDEMYEGRANASFRTILEQVDKSLVASSQTLAPNFLRCFDCASQPELPQELRLLLFDRARNLLEGDKKLTELRGALKELQTKYGKSTEELSGLYIRLSGDLHMLEQLLAGEDVALWTDLDDLALQSPLSSPEYRELLIAKGVAEVAKRRAFLGL